jgi:raffinose/stachyose/melibiose transport system substrate-binding protein
MSRRRSWLRHAGVAVALSALSLAGCGGGGKSDSQAQTVPKPGSAEAKSMTGEVSWWGWAPGPTIAPIYIKAFNEAYPNVKVTYKHFDYSGYSAALRTGVTSPSGPDIYNLQPGTITQAYGRFAADLTPAAQDALGTGWKDKLAPIGTESFTQNNRLLGLSIGSGAAGTLLINQSMFDKWGLKAPTTLDEWVQTCRTIEAKGTTCFVQGAKDEWINQDMIQSIANSIAPGKFRQAVDGKIPWTDPDLVQALTVFKTLFSNGVMQPGAVGIQQYPDAMNRFLAGKAAMIMQGSWEASQYDKDHLIASIKAAGVSNPTAFTALLIPFPDVAGKGNASPLFADADFGLAVREQSKNKTAATAFAAWLTTSTAGQKLVADQFVQVPALKGVTPEMSGLVDPATQADSLKKILADVSAATEHRQIASSDLVTALGDAASAIATGKRSPQDAAADLQKAMPS